MKKNAIISLLTASLIPLSLTSCKLRKFSDLKSSKDKTATESTSEKTTSGSAVTSKSEAPDTEEIRSHVKELLDNIELSDNEKKVRENIDTLVYDIDACKEALTLITIDYYSDWQNKKLGKKYDSVYENLYVANYFVNYAFAHGYKSKEYSELFAPYITNEESVESMTDPYMTLRRLEGYAKVDYEVMDERIDEYYEIISDDDLSNDEKNIKCAELYLDVLTGYEPETFYEIYNRDYTPDKIIELSKCVKKEILPAADKLADALVNSDSVEDILTDDTAFENPFQTILKYSSQLSPEIEASAKQLNDEKLFTITDDENCYTGSFTDTLPVSDKAFIYIFNSGGYHSISTPVHEFGHFYASSYDDTPVISSIMNIDIAEVQSQGFEFIFSRFYDDIFQDNAEAMHAVKTCDMLDAVLSGFFIGEFEYTVLKNRDTFTPEDVVDCFHDIMDDYNEDIEFYFIPHIFEQPGYYISYGVSALAAFDIWQDCLDAPDKALEKYEKIAHVPSSSVSTTFSKALKECGFSDVLNKKYIEALADEINGYVKALDLE